MKKRIILAFIAGLSIGATAVILFKSGETSIDASDSVIDSAVGEYLYNVEYADAHSGWVDVVYPDDPSRNMCIEFEGRLCPIDPSGRFLVDMERDKIVDLTTRKEKSLVVDYYFEFSQSGGFLALEVSDNELHVYSTKTWELIFKQKFINHSGTIFVNNDRHMLVCHYLDADFETPQQVNVYDTSTWLLVNTLQVNTWVEDLKYFAGTYVYDSVTDAKIDILERL